MEQMPPAIDIAATSKSLQGERRQLRDDVESYLRQLIISATSAPPNFCAWAHWPRSWASASPRSARRSCCSARTAG